MKQVTIPSELHSALKVRAASSGEKLQDLAARGLEAFLKHSEKPFGKSSRCSAQAQIQPNTIPQARREVGLTLNQGDYDNEQD